MKTRQQLVFSLGILMVLFVVIFLGSLTLVFSPVTIHERDMMGNEIALEPSAVTTQGLLLRIEAWHVLPRYNAGMVTVGVVAVIGATIAGGLMYAVNYGPEDAGLYEDESAD